MAFRRQGLAARPVRWPSRAMRDGAELALAMLPSRTTPLDLSVREASRVDLAEALSAGWLTPWYQLKFDLGTAEALVAHAPPDLTPRARRPGATP